MASRCLALHAGCCLDVRRQRPAPSATPIRYSSIVIDSTAIELNQAALLATIADPIRWQLISQLSAKDQLCVCKLVTEPQIPGNLLSYHPRVLREAGLVEGTKRGRWVDYRLTEGAIERLHAALPITGSSDSCGCRPEHDRALLA